jgi:hypothetical protein
VFLKYKNECNCVGSANRGNIPTPARMASVSTGVLVSNDNDELTLANVRDGSIKYNNLRKNKLQLLCGTFLDHIEDLQLN